MCRRAGETTQQVKVLVAKSNDLSSVLRTYMVGQPCSTKTYSDYTHTHAMRTLNKQTNKRTKITFKIDPRKDLDSWEGGLGCSSSSSQTCGCIVLGVLSSVSKEQSVSSGQATEQFLSTQLISDPIWRQEQIKMAARIRFKSAHLRERHTPSGC